MSGDRKCNVCGKENYSTSYDDTCGEKKRMDRDGLCFSCAFWSIRAEKGAPTVIDGYVYTPGNRTSGEFRGMGGRRFDIEYFDDTRITTFDLWTGGRIPERWRDKFPDTARFINNAIREDVGGTTCWDSSAHNAPKYPSPKEREAMLKAREAE